MEVKNTKNLVEPSTLHWKVLIVGRPGVGKSTWLSGAPNLLVAACETGHGSGLLSVAHSGVDYVEPKTFADFRSLCLDTFVGGQGKQSVGLDSLTAMAKGFIKDHVLASFPPRNRSEAMRRQAGVMTGFDYSDVADVTKTLLNQLLSQNKNIVVTALEKTEKDENGVVTAVLPDLPGALATSAAAFFDTVMYLKVRRILKDPRDPRSAIMERYFITGGDGVHVAKDRNSVNSKSILSQEEVFDPITNRGTFSDLFGKIVAGHQAVHKVPAQSSGV